MIDLKKGSRFNLKKNDAGAGGDGSSIERFCVGCKWGMVKAKKLFGLFSSDEDVDLDLSCVMFNRSGEMVDWIYSPDYRQEFLEGWEEVGRFKKEGIYVCCSVAQSGPTFCNPMDCSMPGFPVPHHLPEFAQVHVH